MKKPWLLLIALAGCTGTSEPPTPAWLAIGSGKQVDFYDANGFRPLGSDPALAQSWTLDDNLADLLFFDKRLWLLLPDRLVALPVQKIQGPPEFTVELEFPNGTDCSQGTLKAGEEKVLAICAQTPFAATIGSLEELPTPALRDDPLYALGPDDDLIYITNEEVGVYWDPDEDDETLELDLEYQDLDLQDFSYDFAGSQGYALLTEGSGLAAVARLLPVRIRTFLDDPPAISTDPTVDIEEFEPEKLVLNQEVIIAFGKGFARFKPSASDVFDSTLSYSAGIVGGDGFVYLARGNRIDCYDYRQDPQFQDGRSVTIDSAPEVLALIPLG